MSSECRENTGTTPAGWDQVFQSNRESLRLNAWRKYMKHVYGALLDRWFEGREGLSLKTDLFEEACSEHSLLTEMGPQGVGLDLSIQIARSASFMLQDPGRILVCDLRKLPFLSESFERMFSPSSLDHFSVPEDIDLSLREFGRILKPGCTLILTLDNPHNPVIWLRNHLPFGLLNKLGLVPYYVGPTCTVEEARSRLQQAGFEVLESTAVAHVPRAPAIWLVKIAEMLRSGKLAALLSTLFLKWEALARWPLRYRTGYYIAFKAINRKAAKSW